MTDRDRIWAELPSLVFISLTQGKFAVIDGADLPITANLSWHAVRKGPDHTHWYACSARRRDGKQVTLYLHREIVGAAKGMEVDHENGNGLDNRRLNLRECSHLRNTQNRRSHKRRFRGVAVYDGKIVARFENARFGPFDTVEAAALGWDQVARQMRGGFACLNFPDHPPAEMPPPFFKRDRRGTPKPLPVPQLGEVA